MQFTVPDFIEKVVGFRRWAVSDDGQLFGEFYKAAWTVGSSGSKACCLRPRAFADFGIRPCENPPRPICKCGLYGHFRLPSWENSSWRTYTPYGPPINVFQTAGAAPDGMDFHTETLYVVPGVSLHWGKAEFYATGLRSEYAQPVVLGWRADWPSPHREAVARAANRYYCLTSPLHDLEAMSEEFGGPLPDGVLTQIRSEIDG